MEGESKGEMIAIKYGGQDKRQDKISGQDRQCSQIIKGTLNLDDRHNEDSIPITG